MGRGKNAADSEGPGTADACIPANDALQQSSHSPLFDLAPSSSTEHPSPGSERTASESAEAALFAERRRGERAQRELEALCYSISHDLRAPLRAIDGFSQALVADYGSELPEDARHYVERIRKASARLSAQIDALLGLSRIHAAPLHPTRVDLSQLAVAICSALARRNPGREVRVSIEPDLVAFADPHMAELLLAHLLENAWKFTRRQERAEIEVKSDTTSDAGVFCVRDNGVGFNMAYAERLFAPFQRLHKESDFEGIGVGLAIVQRIANRHEGRVWALAEPSAGATFYVGLGSQP